MLYLSGPRVILIEVKSSREDFVHELPESAVHVVASKIMMDMFAKLFATNMKLSAQSDPPYSKSANRWLADLE